MNLKGTLPTLILRVLEPDDKHGYRIAQEIKATSKGVLDFREGTLYRPCTPWNARNWSSPTNRMRPGAAARYYRLTDKGRKQLVTDRKAWREASTAISLILKEA